MGGVWREIWASLRAVIAGTASVTAFCLALLGSLWDPGVKLQIGLIWLTVFVFIAIAVVATAVKVALDARRGVHGDPPRAIYAYVSGTVAGTGRPLTLIMGRAKQFGVNILVTVYYEEPLGGGRSELFERSIGIGRVVNIQENGLIQVLALRELSDQSELWQRIRSRESATLRHVLIKPSIDFDSVGIEVRFDE